MFLVIFAAALLFSSIGFKKYVWFISLGYGFAVAAIGVVLLIAFAKSLSASTALACVLFIIYDIWSSSRRLSRCSRTQKHRV